VQHLPQVGLRLALGRLWPQQEGQVLTGLRRMAVEQQVGEQGLGARRVQRRQLLPAEAEIHAAEQSRVQSLRADHNPLDRA
jgi:hypothetical protein